MKSKDSAVKQALVISSNAAKPRGVKAGKAVKMVATAGAVIAVAGVGSAYGAVSGFFKGLVS